jgi:DNA ligase-1
MSEDWKNDRAEASMHEFEIKNMEKAKAEYQKTHPKMKIKQILDEIAAVGGKNDKGKILAKYKDNELLKRVIYLAHSPRIKFYIKQIPQYSNIETTLTLAESIEELTRLSDRTYTGAAATDFLLNILSYLDADDAYVIERIIDKNLKIGMDSGINKVIPKLIEETPYQGAKSFSEKGALKLFEKGKAVMSQVKADGTYRNAIIRSGEVELISRQGEVSTLPGAKFLLELSQFEDCVLNGELTIDGVKRTIANGMVSSIMDIFEKEDERGEAETAKKVAAFEDKHGPMADALAKLRFTVWDMITVDEYFAFKSDTEYHERYNTLRKRLESQSHEQVDLIETRFIRTYEEAMDHFLDTQNRGLEGTIIKDSHAGWKDGKPTYQIKMKLEMDMDLRIVGFKYGNKGTKNETVISVLELESECGKLKTAPAGMTEAMMADVTARQEELLGTVVQIRCCGLSETDKGWSTQHPSIVELRTDKDTCDTLESCIEIENMAKTLKAK